MSTWLSLLPMTLGTAMAADDTGAVGDDTAQPADSSIGDSSSDDTGGSSSLDAHGAAWYAGEEGCSTAPAPAAAGLGLLLLGGLLVRRREGEG
jgi:MYXO-CTERM domain-containing protein